MSIQNISFLGAGSIAEAIIGGLLHANVVKGEQITVSNRSNETRLQELHKNTVSKVLIIKNYLLMQIFFSSNETKGCCRGAYLLKNT